MLLICTDSTPPRIFASTRLDGIAPTGCMRSSGCFLESGVAGGFYPPLQGVAKTIGLQQPIGHTPSVSPFGLPAPSEREPRALRASGSPGWRPLQAYSIIEAFTHRCIPTKAHSYKIKISAKKIVYFSWKLCYNHSIRCGWADPAFRWGRTNSPQTREKMQAFFGR